MKTIKVSYLKIVFLLVLVFSISLVQYSCGQQAEKLQSEKFYDYRIMAVYPHDARAFTQGLFFYDGYLYEGTGLYGASSLRKVRLEDGKILKQLELSAQYFGEGITVVNDRIVQLTWKEYRGFVYDLDTFTEIDQFTLSTEGWGLTYDGQYLIMSDGSAQLTYLECDTYKPVKYLTVTSRNGPVENLNELEYINGVIYANVWQTKNIVLIDPDDGRVIGWIDLSELPEFNVEPHSPRVDVLNGIAYDTSTDSLYITGKLWSHIYQIEMQELTDVCN